MDKVILTRSGASSSNLGSIGRYFKNISVPFCRLGKACFEACSSRLVASGGVFLAGVMPDSPSRDNTFLLLRVVVRLRGGGRVGFYVVRWAWSPTIRASF